MSEWDWELTDTAQRDFDGLDNHARDRIATKLDEIVTDQWRDPPDHLEPLQGTPHDKLRIGPFRLGCRADRDTSAYPRLPVSDECSDTLSEPRSEQAGVERTA